MRVCKFRKLPLFGLMLGATLACNLFKGIVPIPPSGTQPSQLPPVPALTASPPEGTAIQTEPVLGTQTPVSLPAIQGPAIQRLTSDQKIEITHIHMINGNQGWGSGGPAKAEDHILRTENGGVTWSDVTPPQPHPAGGVSETALGFFMDASNGWVVYSSADPSASPSHVPVWFTHDGGATWFYGAVDTADLPKETFMPWYLNFSDSQHGWLLVLLGGGMNHAYVVLYSTTDGGRTWTDILDPGMPNDIQSFEKTGMVFVNPHTGWLTRDAQGVDSVPHIFLTQDGGMHWNRIDLPTPTGTDGWFDNHSCGTYYPSTLSADSVILIMKCLDNATYKMESDYLYSTGDTGLSWRSASMPSDFKIPDPPAGGLFFMNAKSGLALNRWIHRTDDGGNSWSKGKQVNWDGQFSFVNLDTGWAVARNAGEIALVKTMDGGTTWQIIQPTLAP